MDTTGSTSSGSIPTKRRRRWKFVVFGFFALGALALAAACQPVKPPATPPADVIAPAAPSVPDLVPASDTGSSQTDDLTRDDTPTFVGTAEPGSTVKIYSNGELVGQGVATADGTYTITGLEPDEGPCPMVATATDAAGNTSPLSGVLPMVLDKTAPAAPMTPDLVAASDSKWNSDNYTNDNTPTFTGTAEDGSTVTIFADGVAVGAGGASTYDITTSALADGLHAITATAEDTAGNVSAASVGQLPITIDTTAPVVTLDFPPNFWWVGSTAPLPWRVDHMGQAGTLSGDSNQLTVTIAGPDPETLSAGVAWDGSWIVTFRADAYGTYNSQAIQTDTAGNVGTSSMNTWTIEHF